MQILNNMNAKLAEGYKLTDASCTVCSGVTMGKEKLGQVYCPKCNKSYPIQSRDDSGDEFEQYYDKQSNNQTKKCDIDEENLPNKMKDQDKGDPVQENYDEFLRMYNEMEAKKKNNSNEVSKKIGAKLIEGWAMLDQACLDCNVPLMASKNKENKICCSCDKNFMKPSPKIAEVKVPKVERKEQKIPIPQKQQNPMILPNTSESPSQIIALTGIRNKCLGFLQARLDKSINDNDLVQFQRVIDLIRKVKQI